MAFHRGFGKILVLSYYLFIFISMLSNSKSWELKLLHIFTQITIGCHKLTGLRIPITGKTIALKSNAILQFTGAAGIFLVFSSFYGERRGAVVILIGSLLLQRY